MQDNQSKTYILSRISYSISTEEENKADNLLEDGLHLLVAALTNG